MISRPCLAVLVFLVAINIYLTVSQALYLEQRELEKLSVGAKGYVSDEVWYVDAARNILRLVFGARPRMDIPRATLVYNSSTQLEKAKELANAFGISIISDSYTKISAIYVEAKSFEDIERFANATNASDVVYGWMLGDAEGINNYLNLEHPPMAKYLIALSMVLLGDRPFFWRIPSIFMSATLVVLTFFLVYEIARSEELSLIATAFVAADPMIKNLGSIALLDIHVATITVLAMLLAIKKKFKESTLAIAFASTFKFTGLIAFVPMLALVIRETVRKTKRFLDVLTEAVYYVLLLAIAFMFMQFVVSFPLIASLGIGTWFRDSIAGAISWHLSVKCVGAECPPSSTPWEWFFGINSFPFYIEDSQTIAAAQGFIPAYTLCFIFMILTLPYIALEKPRSRTAWFLITGLFVGYVALWLAGSRTQYSFYAVQLTPFIYTYLVVQGSELIYRENLVKVITSWSRLCSSLWNALLTIFEE